jgi:phage terminase large subunit
VSLQGAAARIRLWRNDPVQFVRDNFKVEKIDGWQEEALRAFGAADKDKLRLSLQACAGPGKSACLAWMGWNFLSCYAEAGEHPKGAAMSVTSDNLRDNLWAELSKWQGRSEFLKAAFKWTAERIFAIDHPETWFISARSFPKTANAEEQGRTLSGLHAKYVLYLIDESGDINPAVLKAAEQGFSSCAWGRIVQAGNPTSSTGMLYQAANLQRELWYVISITGDPDDPKRSERIPKAWASEQIAKHGRNDPWVMAYILGQFPPTSINALLSVTEVEASMNRDIKESEFNWAQKRLGIDVARFGDDRSVVARRQGIWSNIEREDVMRGQRTTEIAGRVAYIKTKWGSEAEFIDDTGHWGHGVIDNLIAAGYTPMGIQYHGPANNPRYKNMRAEMWLEMANWVKAGGKLPKIPELVAELTVPTYSFVGGKFVLEDKDQVKERLKRSPDLADALALTFAWPDMPGAQGDPENPLASILSGHMSKEPQQANIAYNPFPATRGSGPVQSATNYSPFNRR